jgi:hypothetical protein
MLRGTKWVWISMALATMRFLNTCYASHQFHVIFRNRVSDVTLQAGWTVFNIYAIKEWICGFADSRSLNCHGDATIHDRIRERRP